MAVFLGANRPYLQVFLLVHALNALVGQGEHLQGLGVERHLHRHKVAKYFLETKKKKRQIEYFK